ncbi:unnamed protein product [Parnassius apollo]|uniref:(apollo) hypothetical protein n=1 Tax=Parnassius apollo TaxID=110799 RepID=A0A8S3XVR2_PARAO|nr:unnamed protein product [Parnassius apollo]
MSLIPYCFDYDLPHWSRRLMNQAFGMAFSPEDILSARSSPLFPTFKWWWPENLESSLKTNKDKWQVNIDVHHFAPDEISVKTSDGFIVVEGKHDEKSDEHGFISRQFVRRFKIPDDVNPEAIESRLSSDGVLTVLALMKANSQKGERIVPVSHTGPVRKIIQEDAKLERGEKKKE